MGSTVIKNFTDGVVTLVDGTTPTPLVLPIPFENGDFATTGLKQTLNETAAYESRGKIKSLRYTTRRYIAWSFTAMMADFIDTVGTGTVADFVFKNAGTPFAARVSTADVPGNVDQMHVNFVAEGTDLGDVIDHDFTIRGVEVDTFAFSEGDPNGISLSGTGYLDVTGDIAAAELA